MPITRMEPSKTREATKPSATVSFCRLTTGKSVTAVPMPAKAVMKYRKQPRSTRVSEPEPRMKFVWYKTGWSRTTAGSETKVIK